jgi:hypothetical protein
VRFVAAAAVLLVIVVILLAVAVIVTRSMGEKRLSRRGWELQERSDGEQISVYATKPGSEEPLLGSVQVAAPDFDMRLYELRAEADERVRVLNDRLGSR